MASYLFANFTIIKPIQMKKYFSALAILFVFLSAFSQQIEEQAPPFNIKTISFVQNGNNVMPFFKLGEKFELQFDDLYGDESDYYYTIDQYNYDWTSKTDLAKVEYLNGMDNQRIITYQNSFNTLQLYSHYNQSFPNNFNQITFTSSPSTINTYNLKIIICYYFTNNFSNFIN